LRPERRMSESGFRPANAVLLHCELVDFWQLAAAAGLRCERQFLLYPNPWPKAEHLMRRWHAHPVFPAILALGGAIELRTNWNVYAEEFAAALRLAGIDPQVELFKPPSPLTPFERKYLLSGHSLWRCRAEVSGRGQGTT
jgi:tRNA (guanine-N7-)-methyltransferase